MIETIAFVYELTKRTQEKLFAVWAQQYSESRYPGALSPVNENFPCALSPDPTDCPWVSEDRYWVNNLSFSLSGWHYSGDKPGSRMVFSRAQFLKRSISVNPGLNFCSVFCILHSCALLRVTRNANTGSWTR